MCALGHLAPHVGQQHPRLTLSGAARRLTARRAPFEQHTPAEVSQSTAEHSVCEKRGGMILAISTQAYATISILI